MTVAHGVERLVALQAQVARPPFVGLWTRLEAFDREDLLTEFSTRKVVRGPSLRGTLHVMTAHDFAGLRGAIQPALDRGMLSILRDRLKGVDLDAVEDTAREFFRKAPVPFDDLRGHLKQKYPKCDERAMAYAARMRVPLVQVPTGDPWGFPAAAEFMLADAWLGKKIQTEHTPALAKELVRRYLAAFGPATVRDAQVWSGLAVLSDVFEALRPTLVTFRDERKRELFDLPKAPRPAADAPAPVRFLPEFDNLLLSHDDRRRVIADEHRSHVFSKNLQVRATVLIDGFVAAAWRLERKKQAAVLVVEPFSPIPRKTMAAIEEEGEALLRFTDPDATTRDVRADRRA